MERISAHTFATAKQCYQRLALLQHYNGIPVVHFNCSTNFASSAVQGPIVNLNLRRANGDWVGFAEVSKLATMHGIHLRTGCVCNAGACHEYLGLTPADLQHNVTKGYSCGDGMDLIDGRPVGAIRLSFGYMSTPQDASKFIRLVEEYFLERHPAPKDFAALSADTRQEGLSLHPTSEAKVISISVYPVKSCGAFRPGSWPVGGTGFRFDREWMVVDEEGVCLSQKRKPAMCLIKPVILEQLGLLVLTCPAKPPLAVQLLRQSNLGPQAHTRRDCQARVCHDVVTGGDCGDAAAEWVSSVIGCTARLLRCSPTAERHQAERNFSTGDMQPPLAFSNESQFLLVSASSMAEVNRRCQLEAAVPIDRFRANIVIDGADPFAEDEWAHIRIGAGVSLASLGPCQRCQMVCIDQATGKRSLEPLRTLASFRRVEVGSPVRPCRTSIPPFLVGSLLPPNTASVSQLTRVTAWRRLSCAKIVARKP